MKCSLRYAGGLVFIGSKYSSMFQQSFVARLSIYVDRSEKSGADEATEAKSKNVSDSVVD